MCKLCDVIRNEYFDDDGDEFICKCKKDGIINFVWIDDTRSPVCFPVKYCPKCGRKLVGEEDTV